MEVPCYCIVGRRPVKAVRTEEGRLSVQAFDWKTGEFALDPEYLTCLIFGYDEERGISGMEIDYIDEAEFARRVELLRSELGLATSKP